MAFRIGSAGPPPFGTGAGATSMIPSETGPDLGEIHTEAIGFQSIAGETKLRITPSWPTDAPPPPTASLLSIASHKGLLAAAGPSSIIVATTASIRQAFSITDSMDSNINSFNSKLNLDVGTRVSQISFSADESRLVISAEVGGGLAVYSVQALMDGNTQTEFELSTNGVALRSMLANPTPEKAELFAVVTTNGELMMANLNTRQFLNSNQGQILKDGVSCISWSARGKQLVAGLGNGACFQMTPEGEVKAEIPRPDQLTGDQHVASISWLENNLFLINHTFSSVDTDLNPPSTFHLVTRLTQPQNSFLFQKFPDPLYSTSTKRSPPYCFIRRLREFPPNIQDLIIVASTASTDVGMICRSKAPLTSEFQAETVTNVFTTTYPADDARRVTLPIAESTEGSPIGVALDLSSQENVKRPLPGEEIEESPGPLPGLMILNDDGVLSSWWLVYADSIKQNTIYPGLVHGESQKDSQQPFTSQNSKSAPPFGQATFGERAVVKDNGNPFSEPPVNSFGASSVLGKSQSPWGAPSSNSAVPSSTGPTFGQPGFGSSPINAGVSQGVAFGTTGGIGNRTSPWATPASGLANTQTSSFGQPGGLGMQGKPVFGSNASGNAFSSSNSGGFASFATAPGLLAAAAQTGGESVFSKTTPEASIGTGMDTDTSFGGTPKKDDETSGGLFSGQGFTLGSTFKSDGTAKNDLPKPDGSTSNSLFGGNFGETLGETQASAFTPPTQEAEMDDSVVSNDESSQGFLAGDSMAPASNPDLSKSQFPETVPPVSGGLFGTQAQSSITPAAVQNSTPASSSFETPNLISTTPNETPRKPPEVSRISVETPKSPQVKPEPKGQLSLSEIPRSAPTAPLSPESTSKISHAVGDSSNSSKPSAEDAPLPPDFLPSKKKLKDPQSPITETPLPPDDVDDVGLDEDAPLPPDFLPSKKKLKDLQPPITETPLPPVNVDDVGLDDDEGSGVDVAQDVSPGTDPNQSPKITPESSFGASFDKSPVGGPFTKVSPQQPRQGAKNLFGEVSSTSIPSFPPPSKVPESPRSPSPVRPLVKDKDKGLRPDNARSISAPGHPVKPVIKRKPPTRATGEALPRYPTEQQRTREQELQDATRAQIFQDESQELSDREDEKVREELETEVEPTMNLEPFLAHQDYVGNVSKPGIPGQIETVYRDINSMIDTLGLNARSLKAFVKGHTESFQEGGRSREDLELGNWCLFEIDDLGVIEGKLFERLKEGQLKGVDDKLETCRTLRKDLHKIRSKRHETIHEIQSKSNPKKPVLPSSSPLSPEQYTIQKDLREQYLQVQKLIVEAEEGISALGVLTSSFESTQHKTPASKKPTVEAVTNTIQKMTSMVEKKSLDIDILEAQIKHLRLPSSSARQRRSLSREKSSPSTPNKKSSAPRPYSSTASSAKKRSGVYHSVDGNGAFGDGGGGDGGTPRKRMDMITDEEVERYRVGIRQREEVNAVVRKVFLDGGMRVRGLD